MVSREDSDSKHADSEVLPTGATTVVPELGKQATITKEKISAYFTIAAAAFGLISDGCKSYYATLWCVQG
jgi:hypothetical protein